MRISSLYNSSFMLSQLDANGSRLNKLMEQMATQKRINVPSDDPVAASRLVQLNREQSAIKQYESNISGLSGSLAIQESSVTALSQQLDAMNSKLLSANNSTHTQQDMAGYGAELDSMLDNIVAVMNTKNENGGYLFSGTKSGTQPVTIDANGQYVYNGNDGTRDTQVANGVSVQENLLLAQAFSSSGNDLALLNKVKDLSAKMQDPTAHFADYQSELSDVLGGVQSASSKVASLYTDLGGRQNRLELLKDAHADVSLSNDQMVRDLSDTDWATTSINLQMYTNSMQITNKAYSMISQLNLFSLL